MQHADRCPPSHVSINTIDPPTYISYTADVKHKAPQLEEIPLVLETCLDENTYVESAIPIEILPFFHSHTIDHASC